MCLRVCITGDDFGTILIEPSVSRTANLTSFTDSTPCWRIAISSSDRSTPSLRRCGTTKSPFSMRTVGVPSSSRPQNSPHGKHGCDPRERLVDVDEPHLVYAVRSPFVDRNGFRMSIATGKMVVELFSDA